ncbi:methylated-DNA--[protein]-cysteine S-methyltransferase [Domibacillus tundrae]|uniref:methylated-DNA--[protein]-cysteine S-methyltransferase n=1 Tax=Domibacillus tundrae TaxID=1587527 RepID=UPI0033941208
MNEKKKLIEWSIMRYEKWHLYVAKTEKGICYVGSPGQTYGELEAWIKKRFLSADLVEHDDALKPYKEELNAYFNGTSRTFSLPVDVHGTSFQEQIWEALKQVPYGKTYSYSDIAALIGKPSAFRAVGTAIGANPVLITIPCHRIVGKNGAITGYRGGLELKQYLLDLEANQEGGSHS